MSDDTTVHVPVDEQGEFRSNAVAPGPYRVRLKLGEASRFSGAVDASGRPTFEKLPATTLSWVGEADLDAGQTLVVAGATSHVRVPAPTLSTLEVLVTADGKPVADAHVFRFRLFGMLWSKSGPRSGVLAQNPDDVSTPSRHACVRTDTDGRARFITPGAGQWEFYLRHAQGGATTGPYPIAVASGATAKLTLQLPTSTIRGRFQRPPNPERQRVEAQLYRRAMADDSPFTYADWGSAQQWNVPRIELGADGSFAFPWLPAEAWVVRIADSQGDTILAQRVVTTDGASDIDLGDLARAPTFAVSLTYGVELGPPPPNIGQALQVQWLPPDGGLPVFVANELVADRRLGLAHLAPGRYGARLLTHDRYFAGASGILGHPFGATVEFTVDAAGRPNPPHIF